VARRSKRKQRTDDEILKEFNSRLASSERHMDPIMSVVRRAREVALGTSNPNHGRERDPDDPHDWHSMLFPPIAREKWEVKNAELTVDTPRVDFVSHDLEYSDNAEVAQDAVAYHYDRDDFDDTFSLAMRAATRDGGAVIKTIWEKRLETAFDDDGQPILDDNGDFMKRVTYSGTRNMLCRLEDIFPDPTATTFRNARWVIHRFYATTEDLRARGDFYSNLDDLPQGGSASGDDQKRPDETTEAFEARRKGVHTCYEMWTPYSRVTIANKSLVIRRDDRLTFKHPRGQQPSTPFTMIRTIDNEDSIVGVSMMTLIDALQELYWSLLNGLVDAVNLSLSPPMIADTEEDAGAAKQSVHPNAVLHARNGQQTLKVMQDVAQLSNYNVMQLLDMVLALMDRISGITAALAGVSDAATATEASINVRQGKGRIGAEMAVSDRAWCRVAQKTYCLIQQFESKEVMARLSSGREVQYAPEQLVDMMIVPRSASSERALKDLERQDAQTMWEIAKETLVDPVAQMPTLDVMDAAKRLVEAFGGDPRSVKPPMPPMAQLPPADGSMPAGAVDAEGNPIDPAVLGEIGAGDVAA
jgi:hypothetical protein